MADARSYYAWHRRGLSASLVGDLPAGTSHASIPVTVTLDAAHTAAVPVDLLGPGDVVGLDPAEVTRTEPADGCPDFDPSTFPYVELRDADLPWRFTPTGPKASTFAGVPRRQLTPWLTLVVVDTDNASLTGGPTTAVLHTDAALLPNPGDSWAWAHVQVVGPTAGPSPDLSDPLRALARIICPVHLQGGRRYLACLVPAYAAGVTAAGMDPPPGADPLGPAWADKGQVGLPCYFSWTFGTTAAGSFETLARHLRPRAVPEAATGPTLLIDAPGWGATAAEGATITVQGALRPLSATADAPADPLFATSLAAAVSSSGVGLQLRPPLYGQDHASGTTTVSIADTGWFTELNTDARRRLAAGLAAWAVAVEQEALCDEAWRQLADARRIDPRLADTTTDLQDAVTSAIGARHAAVTAAGAGSSVAARQLRPGGTLARHGFANVFPSPDDHLESADPIPVTVTPARSTYAPTFQTPMFNLLRATAPDWILPGIGDLPNDSIVMVETNPAFVEAFVVGANHALARELQWRRYPMDRNGTLFRTFWPNAAGQPSADVDDLATWDPASPLGSHVDSSDQLVLVLRGSLLRRFPSTFIYLSGQVPGQGEQVVAPTLSAMLDATTTLIAFPMSETDLSKPSVPGQVWSVIVQESVRHTRFGIDDAPDDGSTATLATWQDLDWANPHLHDKRHIPIDGPLNGQTWPTGPTTTLGTPPNVTWATDSGAVAAALTRAPVRVRIPATLWLTARQA
jgi:hypothetical protein